MLHIFKSVPPRANVKEASRWDAMSGEMLKLNKDWIIFD